MTHDSEYMKKMAAIADEYSKRDVSYKTYSAPLPAENSFESSYAKLTAAAPDLLAALTNLVDALVADIPQAADTLRVREARAAIAKATQ